MSEPQAWTLARAPFASPPAAFDADLIARVAAGHGVAAVVLTNDEAAQASPRWLCPIQARQRSGLRLRWLLSYRK